MPRPQYLEVVFVDPDGTKRPSDETRRQAGGDAATVADEQPINDRRLVTPQRLPLRAWCATPSKETTVLRARAPRQDERILAHPEGKMPSWRAQSAAGIFR